MIVREEMVYFVPQMHTKVLNEGWACLVGNSLVLTDQGLLRYDELHNWLQMVKTLRHAVAVTLLTLSRIGTFAASAPTIRLRTRRGLVLEGAEEHKLSIGPDQWMALKDVEVGQRIPLSVGDNVWAKNMCL